MGAVEPERHEPTYWAARCPCGHRACKSWHVWPVAAVQGVSFTEDQARAVALVLNALERVPGLADELARLSRLHDHVASLHDHAVGD